jgi:predicted ATPase
MKIDSFRVLNYKSYLDSGEIALSSGINIVVGKNSVGKSALIEALSLQFVGRPHRSIQSLPHPEDAENPRSEVAFVTSCSGSELRRTFLRSGQTMYMPAPNGMTQDAAQAAVYIRGLFTAERIDARLRAIGNIDSGAGITGDGYSVVWTGGPAPTDFSTLNVIVSPSADRRDFGPPGFGNAGWSLPTLVAQTLTPRLFRFKAERLNIGKCASGKNKTLSADAGNLPEVLFNLNANPHQFREYESLVRRVFPLVETITVRPFDGTQVEIRVWQLPRESRRDDLAFPLDQCGTGIGQVMAILYVVVSSADPQIILIDEPNSFLHPGAARALVQVLREFSHHQYIIATHAPEVLAEAGLCPVIRVNWANGASKCTVFSERTTEVSRQLLTDVGARLSDVFGFDQVLWVEGPSDRDCFTTIQEFRNEKVPGLAILPVRDTGNFERRKAADIVAIYRQASMGSALLPPTIGFLLDREGRTDKEIAQVTTETHGAVSFLDCRMLENYLMDPATISDVINADLDKDANLTSVAMVDEWLKLHGGEPKYGAVGAAPLSAIWLRQAHGAKVLNDLFLELSESRVEFRKTRHCVALVRTLLEKQPGYLDPLASLVVAKLRPASAPAVASGPPDAAPTTSQ